VLYRFVLPLALLVATPVFAQPAPESTAPRGGHLRERLQQVHDRLAITPAQQPQWDAVVLALRDNAQSMRANPAAAAIRSGHLTAVQDLHAAADLAHARVDALQRMIPPVEALYATLSPEQQRMADETLAKAMHAGKGRRG
jgi:protein CpxP